MKSLRTILEREYRSRPQPPFHLALFSCISPASYKVGDRRILEAWEGWVWQLGVTPLVGGPESRLVLIPVPERYINAQIDSLIHLANHKNTDVSPSSILAIRSSDDGQYHGGDGNWRGYAMCRSPLFINTSFTRHRHNLEPWLKIQTVQTVYDKDWHDCLYSECYPASLSSISVLAPQIPTKHLPLMRTDSDASQTHSTGHPSQIKPSQSPSTSQSPSIFTLSKPYNSWVSDGPWQNISSPTSPLPSAEMKIPPRASWTSPRNT